jgi:cytochrome c55X
MRRPLCTLLLVAISLLPLAGTAEVGLDHRRQQALIYMLHQDCGSCHGMRLTGGLGPALLSAELQQKPDAYLKHVIAKGVPDSAMPPWENILEPAEIDFLVTYLKQMPLDATR